MITNLNFQMQGQLMPIVKEKLSNPKWCDINLKVYNYNFGEISQCKFTIKSLYPAIPIQEDEILPKQALTLPRKSQKQLFKDEATANSKAVEERQMKDGSEYSMQLDHFKKKKLDQSLL